MNMNIDLPYPIINKIFEYLSGLNNRKWQPLLDHKTGKLKWKMNTCNQATQKIEKMLKFKLENPPLIIPLLYKFLSCNASLKLLKKSNLPLYSLYTKSNYLVEYERNGFSEQAMISILKNEEDDYIILCKEGSYIFRDYLPEPAFWITKIDGIIWNNYGITFIVYEHYDGWQGNWNYLNNHWIFNIELPEDFLEEEEEQEENDDP